MLPYFRHINSVAAKAALLSLRLLRLSTRIGPGLNGALLWLIYTFPPSQYGGSKEMQFSLLLYRPPMCPFG
jgi:hypothetical protein